jgi:uncharacterized protein YaaN involved in tellurite resistance
MAAKQGVDTTAGAKAPSAAAKRITAPEGLKADEVRTLKQRAKEIVGDLERASGSKELEAIDSISNLGIQSQRSAASELNLLRARVGEMLSREGPAAAISGDMVELRMALRQINPHEIDDKGILGWLLSGGPLGRAADSIREMLEKIAIRYEPVSKQIAVIEARLREGRAMLAKDNIELRKLYEAVEGQQMPVKRNAFLGELLIRELDALHRRTSDELKRERVRNILHDVSLRVQDLRTMEEVDVQFFVSIDMTRQNNTSLAQAVERTLSLSTNVVVIGLAIQMALARQKRVLEANQRTREFLGDLVATNAAVIKQHTTEIGDAYNNPVIAIEKVTQAHNDLLEALDAADRIKAEGIARARENIAKLAQMSSDLERRAQGMKEVELKSVEA